MYSHSLKKKIRSRIKAKRAGLSPSVISQQSHKLSAKLRSHPLLQSANNIGFYMPFLGEIDPCPFVFTTWQANKKFYLPTLSPSQQGKLVFVHVQKNTPMIKNKFGILEPSSLANRIPAVAMDAILCPLVAFDPKGHRLGMGAGYYDKTFSFKARKKGKPWLIGLAYDFQEVGFIPHNPRDIPLELIVTPSRILTP